MFMLHSSGVTITAIQILLIEVCQIISLLRTLSYRIFDWDVLWPGQRGDCELPLTNFPGLQSTLPCPGFGCLSR